MVPASCKRQAAGEKATDMDVAQRGPPQSPSPCRWRRRRSTCRKARPYLEGQEILSCEVVLLLHAARLASAWRHCAGRRHCRKHLLQVEPWASPIAQGGSAGGAAEAANHTKTCGGQSHCKILRHAGVCKLSALAGRPPLPSLAADGATDLQLAEIGVGGVLRLLVQQLLLLLLLLLLLQLAALVTLPAPTLELLKLRGRHRLFHFDPLSPYPVRCRIHQRRLRRRDTLSATGEPDKTEAT
mmetsp:Transcript_46123/g.134289  ORF Transcript_46123/g.134289 Transcript_46123/m.134289 type:complete len:241 (+) Transcript_46123:504-1226(+)